METPLPPGFTEHSVLDHFPVEMSHFSPPPLRGVVLPKTPHENQTPPPERTLFFFYLSFTLGLVKFQDASSILTCDKFLLCPVSQSIAVSTCQSHELIAFMPPLSLDAILQWSEPFR